MQVQTTDRSDWLECDEGAELMSLLQDFSTSTRCEFCGSNACMGVCVCMPEFSTSMKTLALLLVNRTTFLLDQYVSACDLQQGLMKNVKWAHDGLLLLRQHL